MDGDGFNKTPITEQQQLFKDAGFLGFQGTPAAMHKGVVLLTKTRIVGIDQDFSDEQVAMVIIDTMKEHLDVGNVSFYKFQRLDDVAKVRYAMYEV